MRRARVDVGARGGPIGNFLFLGPTGVGKTETAKALAHIYFGNEDKMIRLDMSEFQETKDIKRLIGSSKDKGLLTTAVRENPFSLVLLDEIEKAHPNILNLFLQMLDEGWVTDGTGRRVDFQNTIIIATSNAGAALIVKDIQEDEKMDIIKDHLLSLLFEKNIFRPEFINRLDQIIIFQALTADQMSKIVEIQLKKLSQRLSQQSLSLKTDPAAVALLAKLGYDPAYGARPLMRIIQNQILDKLALLLIEDKIKSGDTVKLTVKADKLNINK